MNHSVGTMMRNTAFTFLALIVLCVSAAGAQQPQSSAELLRKQYEEMISYRIVHTFPVRNVTVVRGPATFELIAGEIEINDPVRGRYHAAVFSGEGVVRYTPPTQTEKDHLRKFTEKETLNEPIKWVVLRFSDATAEELLNHTAHPNTCIWGESC